MRKSSSVRMDSNALLCGTAGARKLRTVGNKGRVKPPLEAVKLEQGYQPWREANHGGDPRCRDCFGRLDGRKLKCLFLVV